MLNLSAIFCPFFDDGMLPNGQVAAVGGGGRGGGTLPLLSKYTRSLPQSVVCLIGLFDRPSTAYDCTGIAPEAAG